MASTYSNLKIQLMATGENSGTWGNVTNDNLGVALEEAIVGSADVTFASGNVTLTLTDTNASQTARNLRLNLVGTTGGARDLIVPAIEKVYIVNNGCADTITVKNNSGTGIAVPAGKTMYVYNNGTNVLDAITHLTSLTLATALPITSGGTGSTTGTFSGANITSLNASSISSGTLDNARLDTVSVAKGGTGQTTYTDGQLLIGNTTGNTLAKNTLTAGTGIGVTNGAGAITINCNVVGGGGFSGSQGFTNHGTFSAPPTTNKVYVMLQAGGGGGGGAGFDNGNSAVNQGGNGGGGGAAVGVVSVTGGSNYPVTVGGAGNGGNSSNNNGNAGNAGGASSFSNLISANGGGGGNGGSTANPGNQGAGGNGVSPTGTALSTNAPGTFSGDGGTPSVNPFLGGGGRGPTGAFPPTSSNGAAGSAGYVFVAY
jgi:hypothetical protein